MTFNLPTTAQIVLEKMGASLLFVEGIAVQPGACKVFVYDTDKDGRLTLAAEIDCTDAVTMWMTAEAIEKVAYVEEIKVHHYGWE